TTLCIPSRKRTGCVSSGRLRLGRWVIRTKEVKSEAFRTVTKRDQSNVCCARCRESRGLQRGRSNLRHERRGARSAPAQDRNRCPGTGHITEFRRVSASVEQAAW